MILAALITALLIGAVVCAIVLTVKWIMKAVKKRLQKKQVHEVALVDLQKMISDCDNRQSIEALESMQKEGYGYAMASIDDDGQIVDDIDLIKDKNSTLDREVEELLGRDRMVVIGE